MRTEHGHGRLALTEKNNKRIIGQVLSEQATRWSVKIYEQAIVSSHIHLVILAKIRSHLQGFLRSVAGIVATRITKSVKGRPFGKFWLGLTFTRVVEWGRAFAVVCRYVVQNAREAAGLVPFAPRKKKDRLLCHSP
ncbi:MAG: transposase [Deltaproteobacteria bacterium]|nr:transposase [Deltaproteobacteria bacterium]